MNAPVPRSLTKADFTSDQTVRWCPGCGDYSILSNVQKVFPELGVPRENIVFISGIGCSSRFPYYMNTYGMHTIHGRAPAFATGLKIARPELSLWLVTGDGDGLSIGGNHLFHILRRNVDVNILLFNNRVYGLTKGQSSPTSEFGMVTKSTPGGAFDQPVRPVSFALSSGATFVARALDTDPKGLQAVFKAAAAHHGTAFVEILQNCPIFNEGTWNPITERSLRKDRLVRLEAGKPLVFGKDRNKGIRLRGLKPMVVEFDPEQLPTDLLYHDPEDDMYSHIVSQFDHPDYPVPLGVIHQEERSTHEDTILEREQLQREKRGAGELEALIRGQQVWTVN